MVKLQKLSDSNLIVLRIYLEWLNTTQDLAKLKFVSMIGFLVFPFILCNCQGQIFYYFCKFISNRFLSFMLVCLNYWAQRFRPFWIVYKIFRIFIICKLFFILLYELSLFLQPSYQLLFTKNQLFMSEYPKSETSNILYPLDSKNWFGSTIDAVYLFFFLSTITSGSQLEFFQLLFYKAISQFYLTSIFKMQGLQNLNLQQICQRDIEGDFVFVEQCQVKIFSDFSYRGWVTFTKMSGFPTNMLTNGFFIYYWENLQRNILGFYWNSIPCHLLRYRLKVLESTQGSIEPISMQNPNYVSWNKPCNITAY